MIDRFVAALVGYRGVLLGLAVALVALAYYPSTKITIDRRIDRMFSPEDQRFKNYQDFKNSFGDSETTVVGYDDPMLFTVEGMERLESFHDQISQVDGVTSVLSLKSVFRQSAPLDRRRFSQQLAANAVTPEALRSEILSSRIYRGRFVSEDGKTPLLWVEIASSAKQSVDRAKTIRNLREVCAAFDPTAVLAGGPVLVDEVFTNLERDGWTLGAVSSLVLTLVIALLFRNLRWVLLPMAVVQATLVWTKAILVLSGLQLSMVSSPLVALVTVIGVATIVHITVRFREERQTLDTEAAFIATLKHIGPAIFWTCATTVAGFAVLMVSRVLPVRDFGIMMSIGSGLVFVAAIMLAPAFILMFPSIGNRPATNSGEKWLGKFLEKTAAFVEHYPKTVLSLVAIFVALVGFGISKLQMATDFNENFRKESLVVKSFDFLVERMDGINVLEVVVDVPLGLANRNRAANTNEDQSADFNQFTNQLRELQRSLEAQPRIAQSMSLADLLDIVSLGVSAPSAPESRLGSKPSGLQGLLDRVPDPLANLSDRIKLGLLETAFPSQIARFWNRESAVTRIVVQGRRAVGSAEKHAMIRELDEATQREFPGARVTGSYVLMVYLMDSLMKDQWITFAISIALILAMLSIAFRSLRLGVIGLIPNVTPILMVLGAMGWLGMKINIASAMLASVSLGLSVDFSIHYISRYLHELSEGKDFFQAIAAVQGSVGLAMVLANLALISGFLVLLLSSLIPTVHFGLLVSVAMMGGLIGNLFILPLLLRYLGGHGKVQS
jgi:predicted RND superfamily exporter protein